MGQANDREPGGARVHKMMMLIGAVICLGLAAAGCGGQSQSSKTAATASCLRVSLVEQYLHDSGGCSDTSVFKYVGQSYKVSVDCTHQSGNVYVCQAKTTNVVGSQTSGFYQVTYDGHSIVYQQTQ